MGNLSFLVPTKNLKIFNQDKIFEMLQKEFPEFKISSDDEFKEISVRTKKDVLVTEIFCNTDCYLVDYDQDIEYLKDSENHIQNPNELIFKLEILRKFNPDLHNCLSLTYGTGMFVDDKFRVERFLTKQFNGYLFDEGIHPEFQTFEEVD